MSGKTKRPGLLPTRASTKLLGTSKEWVAEGEDPRTEAVGGRAEVQVAIHLQRCDRDVRPVEKVADIEDEKERQESQTHPSHGRPREVRIVPINSHTRNGLDSNRGGHCAFPMTISDLARVIRFAPP